MPEYLLLQRQEQKDSRVFQTIYLFHVHPASQKQIAVSENLDNNEDRKRDIHKSDLHGK